MALVVAIAQFITVYTVATAIRTTVEVETIIITTITGRIVPTGRIAPTDLTDRPLYLHKDQGVA